MEAPLAHSSFFQPDTELLGFLESLGLERFAPLFDADELDMESLPLMQSHDFEEMGIDPEKVNPLGGAIALGHPLGATGAILSVTCAHALRRTQKRYGLVTMCIGGGQGIALVLEAA